MTISADRLTTEEILRLNRDYTFFSWSAQAKINPIVIDRAEGIYFWDPDGKRYTDFNSQLNAHTINHSHANLHRHLVLDSFNDADFVGYSHRDSLRFAHG